MPNQYEQAAEQEKKRIAVLASGSGTNFQSLLDNRLRLNGVFAGLISDNPDAYALERAQKHHIETFPLGYKQLGRTAFFARLKETLDFLHPDLIVLAGFIRILPAGICTAYENRIVNIHPALIPSFCGKGFYGSAVHEAVVKAGVKLSGATVHFVTAEADAGPIIAQRAVPVYFEDDAATLQKRILAVEHELLPSAVSAILAGNVSILGGKVRVAGTI